ncbi:tetratricopeptide repeat protein [Nonomuraea jiangxiensis]|uniref:Tetratricopeptide repeat-containing protein n=1 Tax=Nonomuraea jiangxiensis TaxID=633440 RepID=A0A1G9DA70_9ACTN|nr:tetratricopeptide repeat protein [Nonomuraea jiangxiensis]SDK60800.1 Tetratricopeptide repeat-containing protein [Nonomuraea jiangxiensis]
MTTYRSEPYVGLRSYSREDHERFFGRGTKAYEIAVMWHAHRLTTLYGPSGVGKTSVLEAGVLPRLAEQRVDVLPIGRLSHGSAFPLAALPERNPFTVALLSSWAPGESLTRLAGLTVKQFLRRRGPRTDKYGDPVPVLVAIDQAEELFFDFPHRQAFRDPFISQLAEALDDNEDLRLLLSIREDYFARFLAHEEQLRGGGSAAAVALAPLREDEALAAVRDPLARTGRSYGPQAAETLVRELRTVRLHGVSGPTSYTVDTVEPVQLQIVCSSLWQSCPPEIAVITPEYVEQHADVDRSLGDFLSRALEEIAHEHDVPPDQLSTWLRETFITELGTRGTAYEGETQTAGMPNSVVKALVDRHILKVEVRAGSRWCELQHDRLLQPVQRAQGGAAGPKPGAGQAPASAEEFLRVAEQVLADGDLRLAETHAQRARRLCGEDEQRTLAEIESFLGNLAYERGDWPTAEACYKRGSQVYERLRETGAVARSLAAAGRVILHQGRADEAVAELQSAVQRVPHDLNVQVELAVTVWHAGSPPAALSILHGVLSVDGDTPLALQARGEILADLGKPEQALRDLDRVRDPEEPATIAARALALAELDRAAEAIAELDAALTAGRDQGLVAYLCARALHRMGNRERADQVARDAIRPPLTAYQRRILADLH